MGSHFVLRDKKRNEKVRFSFLESKVAGSVISSFPPSNLDNEPFELGNTHDVYMGSSTFTILYLYSLYSYLFPKSMCLSSHHIPLVNCDLKFLH